MTAREPFDSAERLRELVCGRDPLPQDFLVAVGDGNWFTRGSVTPPLGTAYAQLPNGLLVPQRVAREPAPIDQVKLYLTAQESLGGQVGLEEVLATLGRVPVET